MAYPTAEQVKSAYSTDLAPVASGLAGIGDMPAQQNQLARQRRKEQQAQQITGLGLISDAIDPLSKGTGYSPYDDLNTSHIGQVKGQATKMVMAGADPASIYLYLQSATNGIKARQADVTKVNQHIEDIAKVEATKNPYLDPTLLAQGMRDKVFYNTDDKGSRQFNPNFDPSSDFTSGILNSGDEALLPYVNQAALGTQTGDVLQKRFPAQQVIVPGIDPLTKRKGHYTGSIAPYYAINPTSGKAYIPAEPIQLDENAPTLFGAQSNAVDYLKADPTLRTKLLLETKQYQKMFPKANTSDVERVAAHDILSQHGTKGDAMAKFSDDISQLADKQAKDREDSFYKAKHLQISENADARAGRKELESIKSKQSKDLNSPFGIASLGFQRTKDPHSGLMVPANPDQFRQLHAYDEQVTLPGTKPVIGSNLNMLSGRNEKPIFIQGKPALVHLVDLGAPMLTVQFLQKRTNAEGKLDQVNPGWAPSQETPLVLRGGDFARTWESLAPQLGLKPGKLDQEYNNQPADNYPDFGQAGE